MGNKQNKEDNKNNKNIATIIYSNGDRYEGEIYDCQRNGFGTYYYEKGEKYQGMWENNFKHGRGTMFYRNDEVYEGWWIQNKKEGVGTFYYPNGDYYYGEWKDNKRHGNGLIQIADGTKFIGQFKLNKKNGKGETIQNNKEIQIEEWNDGKLIKKVDKFINVSDYHKFDPNNFQKIINNKNNLQIDNKKNKFLPLEIAKIIRSRNISNENSNVIETLKSFNQELFIGKQDIFQWKNEDIIILLKSLDLEKYSYYFIELNIDGLGFLNLDFNKLINTLNITEKSEISLFLIMYDIFKKLKKETDFLKSMKSFKSYKLVDNHKEKDIKDNKIENNNIKKDFENDYYNQENETYSPSQNISSHVNLNGLSFYINFDEIQFLDKVGEGGFGEVFLGKWNGVKVAIKKLSVKHFKNRENISKFINEINIISSLRHPNIVLYIGASIDCDNYYMITEYLPGGSLFDYIRKGKGFIEKEQISIAYEMAVAVLYLHSRSIVHCDLKSSNILIDNNQKVKIGDFGLSQFLKDNKMNRGKIGTPHWMAPEILKGGVYEYSSDVWSYGMILWEILKLEIPYYGLNPYQIYNLVVKDKKIVDIPTEGHDVLISLIRRCLSFEPNLRPTIKEIVNTLQNLRLQYRNDSNLEDLYHFLC